MIRLGPHPSAVRLAAWFDGEEAHGVGSHVARCPRCRREVSELARVRAWLRAQPFFAMADAAPFAVAGTRRRRIAVVAACVVAALVLPSSHLPRAGDSNLASGRSDPSVAAARSVPAAGAPGAAAPAVLVEHHHQPAVALGAAPAQRALPARPVPPRALRLGLAVPNHGADAAAGTEILRVLRQQVEAFNASGGVGGLPVELVVLDADALPPAPQLSTMVDTLVGGFGPSGDVGVTWLFPADPSVSGPNVLSSEASPRAVGAELGASLVRAGVTGPVGVIVGGGPERALADGLAATTATVTVAKGPAGCGRELRALQLERVMAVAIAAPPSVVVECVAALDRGMWRPPAGLLVPPSAAYAGLGAAPVGWGARTVLAMPAVTAPTPGASRFRGATASLSQRALVSFAAAELAVAVARRHGAVTLASIAAGVWPSDLLALDGTTSAGRILVSGPTGWVPAP